MVKRLALITVGLALVLPAAAAQAAPPPNDDRATAAVIPTFPATIAGTTVDATVERLDPQVSQCGAIESTVWYQVVQSPDGTIAVGAQGSGFSPVVRAYKVTKNGISEIDCASAAAGQRAEIAFESVRGAQFFIVVGKKPGTADGAFALDARLFLPPANDSAKNAQAVKGLPASVKGSTLGATTDSSDPDSCSIAGGSVWYTVAPGKASRLVFRLEAAGDLDAAVVVQQKVRSQIDDVACVPTDKKGVAVAAVDVAKNAQYRIVVGQRKGSSPGEFVLRVLAAQAAERAPGTQFVGGAVQSTVNGLTDVNDMWWRQLSPGAGYRIAFTSKACATLRFASVRNPDRSVSVRCAGYGVFTPGPDEGGRYTFEVVAPHTTTTASYRLQIAGVQTDDIGMGLALENLVPVRGSLNPSGVDVVDLYHFDVARTSDVNLRLAQPGGRSFHLALVRDDGVRLSAGGATIQRRLEPGRYVVAVDGTLGTPSGRYRLSLVVRTLTTTSLSASATEIMPGASVTFRAATSPSPEAGVLELRIDRFDPMTGWHFYRLVKLNAPAGSLTWTPPALGRWRAHVSFLGSLRSSPSGSGSISLLVARPIH